MDNPNLLSSELQVDAIAFTHLKETARWARFLAIVGFVFSGILVILAFFPGVFRNSLTLYGVNQTSSSVSGVISTIVYLIIVVIYFLLTLFLYRFATKMKIALDSTDQENFGESLMNLKMVYRILGIITIIYLSFVALAIVLGIGAAFFMR